MPDPLKYNKNFDALSDGENQLLGEARKSIADFVAHSSSISGVPYATRNAHAKTYAVVKGKLVTEPELRPDLLYLFGRESYDITVRLSNAHLKINRSGKDIPAYGFAVKVHNSEGGTVANYPMVNFPLFPVNSVSGFLKLFTAINRFFTKKWSSVIPLVSGLYHVLPDVFSYSLLKKGFALIRKKNDFMLSFDYHSVGVYRLGDYMVKIKMSPKNPQRKYGSDLSAREAVQKFCSEENYEADVLVQFCYDLKDQPVNTLNREWKNSPFIKIGELKLEKNTVVNPEDCENEILSFNPFENAPAFQPVGKIQKLRDEAYKTSLQTRKKMNQLLKYK